MSRRALSVTCFGVRLHSCISVPAHFCLLPRVPDGKPELVDFQVKELKGLTVSVRGLGYLSWMLNWILKKLTTHFDKQIRSIVESKVRVALAEKLKEIKFEI